VQKQREQDDSSAECAHVTLSRASEVMKDRACDVIGCTDLGAAAAKRDLPGGHATRGEARNTAWKHHSHFGRECYFSAAARLVPLHTACMQPGHLISLR
jgi:hypothetical protein